MSDEMPNPADYMIIREGLHPLPPRKRPDRLLRIIRLAIGAAPLLLCKMGLHDDQPWTFTEMPHANGDRCTRCLRWKG